LCERIALLVAVLARPARRLARRRDLALDAAIDDQRLWLLALSRRPLADR